MPPDAKAPTPKKVKKSTPAPAGPRDSGVQSDANRAPAPRKVRKAKPAPVATPTRAPVSDVRSSGPNYDAKQRAKVKPKPAGNLNSGHRVTGTVHAGTKSSGGLGGLAAVPLSGARLIVHANPTRAALSAINLAATAAHAPGAGVIRRVAGDAEKVTKSIPGDAAELAVTTPSSLYKLGDTVAHGHVKQAAKMLVQPYGQLVRHPEKFVTTHPVTTALMVEPAARVPGRAAGAALRAAGKQTLEREPATLPGSALKVTRVKSRDAVKNAAQTARDRNAGAATVTHKQLIKRVDSFYDAAKHERARVVKKATEDAAAATQHLGKDERATVVEKARKDAQRAAKAGMMRKFAEEFGATERPVVGAAERAAAKTVRDTAEKAKADARAAYAATKNPAAVKSLQTQLRAAHAEVVRAYKAKNVPDALKAARAHVRDVESRITDAHKTARATAKATYSQAIRDAEAAKRTHIQVKKAMSSATLTDPADRGRVYTGRGDARIVAKREPFPDPQVVRVGEDAAVVPGAALRRLGKHEVVGSSKATGAVLFRESRKLFGKSVLPFSKNFLAGQAIEGGARSLVTGTGPLSYIRGGKVIKALEAKDPAAGRELVDRTIGTAGDSGHSGLAQEFLGQQKTLAEAFEGTGLETPAKHLTRGGALPGVRHVRAGFGRYTDLVFKTVNGRIEKHIQQAMVGKAVKQSPLMERHVLGLTDKAIQEAADGLLKPETRAHLEDELHKMYGKYKAFSPALRETIMHSTPFLPWYLNTATFLLKVLPRDHPVPAALLADIDAATEDWRKAQGLSLRGSGPKTKDFLFGTGASGTPIGKFLPFAPKDLAGAAGGLILPQFTGAEMNLLGADWKGSALKGNRAANAALTLGENFVPGLSQVDRVTGLGGRVTKNGKADVLNGKTGAQVKADALRLVNPIAGPAGSSKSSDPVVASGPASAAKKGRTVVRRSAGPVARRKVTRRTTVVRRTP